MTITWSNAHTLALLHIGVIRGALSATARVTDTLDSRRNRPPSPPRSGTRVMDAPAARPPGIFSQRCRAGLRILRSDHCLRLLFDWFYERQLRALKST